jgi:hypothetical protein
MTRYLKDTHFIASFITYVAGGIAGTVVHWYQEQPWRRRDGNLIDSESTFGTNRQI